MPKIKPGFMIHKLSDCYMVMAVGQAGEEFNGMIRLNGAGAYLWKQLEQGIETDALIEKMLERYEDLDRDTAEKDLKEFLNSVAFALVN